VCSARTRSALKKVLLKQIRDKMTNRSARTLHLPKTPSVVQRRCGNRELVHIPPTEEVAVARHVLDQNPSVNDSELKRLLLTAFERVQLTNNASIFPR
jgi:hypothetical protein